MRLLVELDEAIKGTGLFPCIQMLPDGVMAVNTGITLLITVVVNVI